MDALFDNDSSRSSTGGWKERWCGSVRGSKNHSGVVDGACRAWI